MNRSLKACLPLGEKTMHQCNWLASIGLLLFYPKQGHGCLIMAARDALLRVLFISFLEPKSLTPDVLHLALFFP